MNNNKSKEIQFIHIKPNNDKNINNGLLESLNKILNSSISSSISEFNDSINDLYLDYSESFNEYKSNDPVNFIDNFFKALHPDIDVNQVITFYDIFTYDLNQDKDKLYLMLIDKNKNCAGFIDQKDDIYRKKEFNLLGSTLLKYHTNSIAIFGDVFILSINKEYYLALETLDKIKSEIDEWN